MLLEMVESDHPWVLNPGFDLGKKIIPEEIQTLKDRSILQYFFNELSDEDKREQLTEETAHIVPMDKIVRMEGFEKLTKEQQLEVFNYEKNFVGLSKAANCSKGSKSFEEWWIYKKEGIPIDESFREKMIQSEKKLGIELQNMIENLLKQRGD